MEKVTSKQFLFGTYRACLNMFQLPTHIFISQRRLVLAVSFICGIPKGQKETSWSCCMYHSANLSEEVF